MKAVMTACLSVAFGTQIAVNRPCTIEETSGFAVVSDQLIASLTVIISVRRLFTVAL